MSYRPFPNGSSFGDWNCANCDRCWKSKVSDATGRSRCPVENAIALASVSDGQIPRRIAKRLNWDGKTYLTTNCPEREEKRPQQPKSAKKTANGQIELL